MRTIPILLTALAATFAVAACGGEDDSDSTASSAAPAATSAVESTAAESTVAESTAEAETTAAESTAAETEDTAGESTAITVGPATDAATTETAVSFTTMKSGVLTVGTELPDPPFVNADTIGDISDDGYEVEMINEIAKRLGLEVKWVNFPFNALVAGQKCPCDLDVNGVTAYDDRREVVDFSDSYFKSNQGILAQKGTAVPDSAAAKELQWGVAKDTSGLYFLQNTLVPTKEPRIYDSTSAMFLALKAGQVDAVLSDVPIVIDGASKNDDAEVVGQFETGEDYGIVLTKDSPNTAAVNTILADLHAEGFFDALLEKYFPDQAVVPVVK